MLRRGDGSLPLRTQQQSASEPPTEFVCRSGSGVEQAYHSYSYWRCIAPLKAQAGQLDG
jgi:hypothetical protein